jgi:hypothetical protein
VYFIFLCRSDDDVTGQQTKDLEELDKKDCMGNERNGRLKGPVPDVDTLEIGITKVEMGELLNCMKHSNMFISFFAGLFSTVVNTIKVYSGTICVS